MKPSDSCLFRVTSSKIEDLPIKSSMTSVKALRGIRLLKFDSRARKQIAQTSKRTFSIKRFRLRIDKEKNLAFVDYGYRYRNSIEINDILRPWQLCFPWGNELWCTKSKIWE